jgi:preprotein translocase subunit SecF
MDSLDLLYGIVIVVFFAMIIGVVVGTFASLFIASPVAYAVTKRTDKKEAAKAAKEGN